MTKPLADTLPMVSIVIPAYQVAEFLAEAIDSALIQTYTNIEVLVVDQDHDAAMDEVMKEYESQTQRLRLAKPSLGAARNLAIQESAGDIIVQLDGDDCLEPSAVETYVSILCAEDGPDAVFSNAVLFGMPDVEGQKFQDLYPAQRPVTFEDVVQRKTYIFGAMAYFRNVVIDVGCFDDNIRYAEDLDLWMRMLRNGYRIDFTEEVLYRYRRRPGAMCAGLESPKLTSLSAIFAKQLAEPGLTSGQRLALEEQRAAINARLSLEEAKALMLGERYAEAALAVREANKTLRRKRLYFVEVGLRVVPKLVARMFLSRI